jgi:multiple sugar transport system substrate-binding protein
MRIRSIIYLLITSFLLTACSLPGAGPSKVPLTYWGLFESPEVFKPVINDYSDQHQNVTVDYSQKSYSTLAQYKETVFTRLKEGKAPDIIRVHASWVKQLVPYLYPIPAKVMSKDEFSSTFYPSAREALTVNNEIYGIPLEYDGLLLLANKQLLDDAGVTFPQTWEQFRDTASKLTKVTGESKKISQAGAAIGASSNIPHAVDILSLMFLQSGLKIPDDINTQSAVETLTFYNIFFRNDKVWDESLPSSITAFSRGQAAFVFAPSWRIFEIKNLNPGLNIQVGSVPQVTDLDGKITSEVQLASFWVEVVPKASKYKDTAYDFLKFATSSDSLKKMYAIEATGRLFGEAYPRKDMATLLSTDPYLGPLVSGAPKAKISTLVDASGNDEAVSILNKAISDGASGADGKVALDNAKKNIDQLVSKPSVPTTNPTK